MRRSVVAALAGLLISSPAYALQRPASTVDAMNSCTAYGLNHHKIGEDWIWFCMQDYHFAFCEHCRIFGDHGDVCSASDDDDLSRPTCWTVPVPPPVDVNALPPFHWDQTKWFR